jgi:hypothetical protein
VNASKLRPNRVHGGLLENKSAIDLRPGGALPYSRRMHATTRKTKQPRVGMTTRFGGIENPRYGGVVTADELGEAQARQRHAAGSGRTA